MEQELLNLRQRIVESARSLATSGDIAPETRLNILMELSKDDESPAAALSQAFDIAQKIGDDDGKLNAYLDILYEIDSHLGQSDEETESQPANNTEEVSVTNEESPQN